MASRVPRKGEPRGQSSDSNPPPSKPPLPVCDSATKPSASAAESPHVHFPLTLHAAQPGLAAISQETHTTMTAILNANKVKADIDKIIEIMTANTDFVIKDIPLPTIKTDATALGDTIKKIDSLELQITPVRNQRDDLARKLNEVCTRARAGLKGFYGVNSSQYEQAGGTRAIERKSPSRKAAAASAPTPAA